MSSISPRHEVDEYRSSYKWMALVVVLIFGSLIVRVAMLQLVDHETWSSAAEQNITKTLALPPSRGKIIDVHGTLLATNRPSFDVEVIPRRMKLPDDALMIARLMELDTSATEALVQRLTQSRDEHPGRRLELFTDISRTQLAALEAHQAELQSILVHSIPLRSYPFAEVGAHLLGYLNEVGQQDLSEVYRAGDRIGRSGVERLFERYLRGRRGSKMVVVDASGREQVAATRDPVQMHGESDPRPGDDVVLTLDMGIMQRIDEAFRGYPSGAAVVVDVNTGAIRALYSKPSYDPNAMGVGVSAPEYQDMVNNPFRPLIDKATYETYFPGSTFKPITAIAALMDEQVALHDTQICEGSYRIGTQSFRCHGVHGRVDLHNALVRSCNVFFWKLAEQLPLESINNVARAFGLGERSGIGVNSEAAGTLVTREWYKEHYGSFRPGFTLNTAIGQGNTRVTVLQLAMMYAAISNGGVLYQPQVVARVQSSDGALLQTFAPVERRRLDVGEEILHAIREGLHGVISDPTGTAHRSRVPGGVSVGGKTGTAQVVGRSVAERAAGAWYADGDHAWFAGFAPVESPQLAMAVLVEHGGGGGASAAPIVTHVLDFALRGKVPAVEEPVADEVKP